MKGLNEREQRILQARRLAEPPLTLEDLATEFCVSRAHPPQIEVRAFEKLQKAVRDKATEMKLLTEEDGDPGIANASNTQTERSEITPATLVRRDDWLSMTNAENPTQFAALLFFTTYFT